MKNKEKYYQECLSSRFGIWDFSSPSAELSRKFYESVDKTFLSVTTHVIAPVLVSYILWVLKDARERGIKSLLFMARDGIVMCDIAKILCNSFDIDIECKCFYASRYSLRLPLYVINKSYALDLLGDTALVNKTAQTTLISLGLTQTQVDKVLNDIHVDGNAKMNADGLRVLRNKLEESVLFDTFALSVAANALTGIEGYFLQNIPENFALVDAGWAGSVQKCFAELYHHFSGKSSNSVTGYYFGMFKSPPPGAGTFYSYYFSYKNSFYRSVGFCRELFESMCMTEHGRTIGYMEVNNTWVPVFSPNKANLFSGNNDIRMQTELCITYAELFISYNKDRCFQNAPESDAVEPLIKSFMYKPSYEEAVVFGGILFAGDLVELEGRKLARKLSSDELKSYSFVYRLFRKILNRPRLPIYPIIWRQGTFMLSDLSVIEWVDIGLFLLMSRMLRLKNVIMPLRQRRTIP